MGMWRSILFHHSLRREVEQWTEQNAKFPIYTYIMLNICFFSYIPLFLITIVPIVPIVPLGSRNVYFIRVYGIFLGGTGGLKKWNRTLFVFQAARAGRSLCPTVGNRLFHLFGIKKEPF
jgi:hypothetical protein